MEKLSSTGIGIPILASNKGTTANAIIMPKAKGDAEAIIKKPYSDQDFKKVAKESSLALQTMHAQGIVHNDWKLDNLLLHDGTYKIADLGSARFSNAPIGAGDPRYLDPSKGALSHSASDVYSQGVCLGHAYLRQFYPSFDPPDLKMLRSEDPRIREQFMFDSQTFQYRVRGFLEHKMNQGDPTARILYHAMNPNPNYRPTAQQLSNYFNTL